MKENQISKRIIDPKFDGYKLTPREIKRDQFTVSGQLKK